MTLSKFGLPAWVLALIAAWSLSIEAGAAATLGVIIQWSLKAPKKVADWASPVAAFGIGGALFVFVLGHKPDSYPTTQAFISALMLWVSAALGTGSVAGHTGGAPSTNSL